MTAQEAEEKGSCPAKREIAETLGKAAVLWDRLHADLSAEYGPLAEKWTFSKKTNRWSLQLRQKKRTILYMIAGQGVLIVAFALGEKACAVAQSSGLPAPVLEVIEKAQRFPEGRGVWLEVRFKKDLESIKKLAAVKMAH
jgi:hypothetical protein